MLVGASIAAPMAGVRAQTVTPAKPPVVAGQQDPAMAAEQTATGIADAAITASPDAKPADDDETPDQVVRDEIVVTGTRIVRPNMTSNAPITVIDEKFLRERGLARIEDALAQIPQVTPMLGLQGNGWTSGRAPVGLRRLGAGRTLTLLNGQRVDNDAGLIPGALIERIDILTGGASAVYGSDAIAGVVNYVVKRRFNGLIFDGEVSGLQHHNDNPLTTRLGGEAGYRIPQEHFLGGGNFYASVAAGRDLFGGRVNVSAFATYKEAKPLRFSDIDTTLCPLAMNPPNVTVARNDTWTCGGAEFNPYGYFRVNDRNYANARDGSRVFRPYDPTDVTRVPRDDYIQRQDRTLNAGGFLTASLFSDIKLDGNFLYSRTRQYSEIAGTNAFYTGDVRINCDNPFLGAQQASVLCGAAAGTTALANPATVSLWRDNYLVTNAPHITNWRGSVALSGSIVGKIRFEASYQRSRDTFRNTGTNIYTYDYDAFARTLQVRNVNGVPTCLSRINGTDPACVPVDAFSANATQTDAAWDYLTGIGRSRTQADLEVVNGLVSGTLEDYGIKSPFADNGIGFAIVAEQRRNRFQSGGDGMWANWTTYDGRATVRELAGELDVPLVSGKRFIDELAINGGYRLSDYSTYDRLVHTWKVEGSYQPLAGLRFRGSYNRALRVPVLERLEGENRYPNQFATDLCAPPAAGSPVQRYTFEQCSIGMTRAQYDALTSYRGCNQSGACPATLINGGNPALQPERSRSVTAGIVAQPAFLPGFSATADYYDINIEAAFEWSRWWLAFDQCYNNRIEFWCGTYRRDATTGQVREIDARYSNSGFFKSRGFDFTANYTLDPRQLGLGGNAGTFGLSFNGTLATRSQQQFAPNTPTWSCLGYFGFGCGSPSPKWRHVAGLNWQLPWVKAGINLTWRYIGGTDVSKLSPDSVLTARPTAIDPEVYPLIARIRPVSYFDLSTNVVLTKFLSARFNVQNLLDRDPPLIGANRYGDTAGSYMNTYPTFYTVRGRTLVVGLSARF